MVMVSAIVTCLLGNSCLVLSHSTSHPSIPFFISAPFVIRKIKIKILMTSLLMVFENSFLFIKRSRIRKTYKILLVFRTKNHSF